MKNKTIKAYLLFKPHRLKGKWQGQTTFLCRTKKEAKEVRTSLREKIACIKIEVLRN